jgi:hypothetical protein
MRLTLDFRRDVWRLGLGVAEAMDTAQRGMGMDWPTALELDPPLHRCFAGHPRRVLAGRRGADDLQSPRTRSLVGDGDPPPTKSRWPPSRSWAGASS